MEVIVLDNCVRCSGLEEDVRIAHGTIRKLGARPFTLVVAVKGRMAQGCTDRLFRLRPDANVPPGEVHTGDTRSDESGGGSGSGSSSSTSGSSEPVAARMWSVFALPPHYLAAWDVVELEEEDVHTGTAFPTGLARSALQNLAVRQDGLVRLHHLNGSTRHFRCRCVLTSGSGAMPKTHALAETIALWGLVHPTLTTVRILPRETGHGAMGAFAAPASIRRVLEADQTLACFDADIRALLLAAMVRPSSASETAAAEAKQTRSVLLHGAAGCGKRELVRAVAHVCGARVLVVNPSHLFEAGDLEVVGDTASQRVSASAPPLPIDLEVQRRRRLLRAFRLARVLAGQAAGDAAVSVSVIVMFERLDVMFPRQASATTSRGAVGEDDFDLLLQFIGCMAEHGTSKGAVGGPLICGVSDRLEQVHPCARAAFDLALLVDAPSPEQRLRAFRTHALASDAVPFSAPALAALSDLSSASHGFVMADVAAVVRDARAAAQRQHAATNICPTPPCEVSAGELHEAARRHCPVALRGGMLQAAAKAAGQSGGGQDAAGSWTLVARPQVSWADVAGQLAAKQALTELVVWPHQHASALQRLGIAPVRGVLLHGPPGTGKVNPHTHLVFLFFFLSAPSFLHT